MKICVLIPAYNASETIGSVVKDALRFVSEVIVADDGSADDTPLIASDAGAEVIKLPKNKGKGNALKILFQRAMSKGYDAIITMDADSQHDPEEIPDFLKAHEDNPDDIIVGSRMAEKEKIPRARYNSMHVARFYISLAANQFIEDTQCGFRLYPLSVIKRINLLTERYVTETELLIKAGDMGTKIRFIPIKAIYNGGGSHFRPIMDVARITTYVISYLTMKWVIEGVSSEKIYTYNQKDSFRDSISKIKTLNLIFQTITVFTTLPVAILFYLEYLFLKPLIGNNFLSVRRLNKSFIHITFATLMLPILLIIAIIEKTSILIGIKFRFLDRIIQSAYPNLWDRHES